MARRALLVGIDHYDYVAPLGGCVADVLALRPLLQRHADGAPNYEVQTLTSPGSTRLTKRVMRNLLQRLFAYDDTVLFYFSGHGISSGHEGYIVTQDGIETQPGIPMQELLDAANASPAREILIMLDCCYSGDLGALPSGGDPSRTSQYLREGITFLAASRSAEPALEVEGNGLFTKLVIDALSGGAADIRGHVSAAAIYAHVEQALGAWEQRPIYRSNAAYLAPVRRCEPDVSDHVLRQLAVLFPDPEAPYALDPSYEFSDPRAVPEHVAIFNVFKAYRNARLLRTRPDQDLYFAALNSAEAWLTSLGRFYWRLAHAERL